MTNCNYTQMTNQEFANLIINLNIHPNSAIQTLKRNHPDMMNELVARTQFLDDNIVGTIPLAQRIYCLQNNISEIPKCKNPNCNNHVGWNLRTKQFLHHCSYKCSANDSNVRKKSKNTNIERYGVDNPAKSQDVQNKLKLTMIKNYGVSNPGQSSIIRDRMKNTCRIKYGVDYPMQSNEIKNRLAQSMLRTYGVMYSAQSLELNKKRKRLYTNDKYPGITFASSWEFKVYDFLSTNHIEFEYQIEPISYIFNNEYHLYFPDFRVNNRIYEVKGDQYFRINELTGKEEMYQPNRKRNISDEQYRILCEKEEAKHQCMISHNVVILRRNEIKNLCVEMFTT